MPAFNYTALDHTGKKLKGVLEGDSSRQIRQQLRDRGLTPLEIKSVSNKKTTKAEHSFLSRGKRIKVAELALITRQMATLLTAGLPVEEMLTAIAEQAEKEHVKGVLLGVRSKVTEGHSLAAGMDDFPRAFPHLYRATVAAGEHSGHLDQVLNRLADYVERQHQMRQKVRQALIYPTLMTLVSIGIVVFLLIYVVPNILSVFQEDGKAQLPLLTSILVGISQVVLHYGLYFLIILIIIAILFKRALRQEAFRARVHHFLLKIPLLRHILRTVNTARFSRTFGILFAAGVPVLDAMKVAGELITLIPMRKAITLAIGHVREGASIHRSLKQTTYFPPMSIHLIASGEASGQLEQMLEKAADNQENDVKMLIESLLTLFEPALIIIMGGIVLFIVLAVLLPVFQLEMIAM